MRDSVKSVFLAAINRRKQAKGTPASEVIATPNTFTARLWVQPSR
jgi:hypothetical protein